jgi:hypothetical protein
VGTLVGTGLTSPCAALALPRQAKQRLGVSPRQAWAALASPPAVSHMGPLYMPSSRIGGVPAEGVNKRGPYDTAGWPRHAMCYDCQRSARSVNPLRCGVRQPERGDSGSSTGSKIRTPNSEPRFDQEA